ncbi:MAG: transcriptional regulator, TrmB [uncultured bacterium]|nr:MAG: transcriptional regulator, TrmB [uncultured bacterium]
MSLNSFLNSIGLDEKSQKTYFALMKLEDAPASIIAKKSGLLRTTTYHHLESLVDLGLATKYKQNGITRFAAENADRIKNVIEGKLALFEKYLPELRNLSSAERLIQLHLFKGAEGVQQIIQAEETCKEKIVRSIGSHKDLRRVATGQITFSSKRVEKGIFSKCLRPKNDELWDSWVKTQQKDLREVKLLPEGISLSGMIYIYDDKVAIITPEEDGLGFMITSKTFSKSLKNIFDALWAISAKA